MSPLSSLALLLFSFIPIVGICQSATYLDADNPGEAVGIMMSSIVTSQAMRQECIQRLPALQNEIDRNMQQWQNTEANNIKKAEFYWAVMVKKQPNISAGLGLSEKAIKNNFDLLSKYPESRNVTVQYCKQYFAALASGVWRKRTPKTYEYLDQAQ
jgi:hypothetical protein